MTPRDISRAVRTRQWAKNALVLGGFVFAGRLRQPVELMLGDLGRVLLALACFCALSGAAYIINDWRDLENDRRHPVKRDRPLAAGRITLPQAAVLLATLLLVAVASATAVAWLQPRAVWLPVVAALYFALTLAYSISLKHEVIVDVLCVASGFVLRVVAGCVAIPVTISPWIVFCTFTLALFVALCKRRAELLELGEHSGTRKVLSGYNLPMLDTFIGVAAGLAITSYSLYTFSAPHRQVLGQTLGDTPLLMATIPFVVYGVFRFLWLAHSSPVGGEPEQALKDRPMLVNLLLWSVLVVLLSVLELGVNT